MFLKKCKYNAQYLPNNHRNNTLHFDIETTGLSRRNNLVYLIGCAWQTDCGDWEIRQLFAENPDDEPKLLRSFYDILIEHDSITHFNGKNFDVPFLKYRYEFHSIEDPFVQKQEQDLYNTCKKLKNFLGLTDSRQSSFEGFLELTRDGVPSGKECISIYRDLIKYRDLSYSDPLLLHNRLDVQGLIELNALQAYVDLLEAKVSFVDCEYKEGSFFFYLRTSTPFPKERRTSIQNWEVHCLCPDEIIITASADENGFLKYYYRDYKNYYYLPDEDTAIHKSVGSYLDKSLRCQATRENCYTRFRPDPLDLSWARDYVLNNLGIILSLI